MKTTLNRRLLLPAASILLSCFIAGCSVSRVAANKLGNVLASGGTAYARDDDPELIASAAPFSLKLMESILEQTPRHRPLLTAAAAGFTQYSYGFIQSEAQQLERTDAERAGMLNLRARHMYLRARDYGLRGLNVACPQLARELRSNPRAAVRYAHLDAVPLLYWTAASWAGAIGQAKDDPDLVADLPVVSALIDRALQLDESYARGTIHSFLITYEMARPDGEGEPSARAEAHYRRALQLAQGSLAAPHVAWAESVCIPREDRDCFDKALDAAFAVDIGKYPDNRLENSIMLQRAAWLRANADRLIIREAAP